jgi:hypothetical protein
VLARVVLVAVRMTAPQVVVDDREELIVRFGAKDLVAVAVDDFRHGRLKMIAGSVCFAWLNRSRTQLAPTLTNISTKSAPEIEKNGTPASPATARASSVLPVPGGP